MSHQHSDNVTIIARLRAKAGREEALRTALTALVPPTLNEPGCVAYDLHVDAEDPAAFCFTEVWRSREDHAANLQTPHLREFLAHMDDLLDGGIEASFLRHLAPEPVSI